MFFAANAVTEDPEGASLLVAAALIFFRDCGYSRRQYEQYTIVNGKVCFSIPGEAEFCFCPVQVKVIEKRY